MEDYYYEFKYVDGKKHYSLKFPADIDVEELRHTLRGFLLGCSWTEEQLDKEIFYE